MAKINFARSICRYLHLAGLCNAIIYVNYIARQGFAATASDAVRYARVCVYTDSLYYLPLIAVPLLSSIRGGVRSGLMRAPPRAMLANSFLLSRGGATSAAFEVMSCRSGQGNNWR